MFALMSAAASAGFHNREEIREIQQMLMQCGFDPGPVDGRWGQMTARAAAQYIRGHGGTVRSGGEVSLIMQVQNFVVSEDGP